MLDIPDHFGEKKFFPLYKGSGLLFFGGKGFRPRDLFVPHTFFVILHILDIPERFGEINFIFLKKGLDLELFS